MFPILWGYQRKTLYYVSEDRMSFFPDIYSMFNQISHFSTTLLLFLLPISIFWAHFIWLECERTKFPSIFLLHRLHWLPDHWQNKLQKSERILPVLRDKNISSGYLRKQPSLRKYSYTESTLLARSKKT